MSNSNKYIELYNKFEKEFAENNSKKVYDTRKEAFRKFKETGIPNGKNENYRYFDFDKLFNSNYEYSLESRKTIVDLNEYFKCEVSDMDTHTVLLSNGFFYEKNKTIDDLPKGVIICGLNEAMHKYPDIFDKYYNKYASESKDGFVNLNTMLANDGLFIFVPENTKLNKTIQLINLTHGFGSKNIIKRNLFIIEQNSEMSLIICDHTLNNSSNFVIDVSESYVGKNSEYKYYTIQNEYRQTSVVNSHYIDAQANAKIDSLILSLHGGITRNNLFTRLSGEHSKANLYGLSLSDKNQFVDNFTFIDHAAPNCTSNELYKSILDDAAKAVFTGRIIVRPDAQKTEAYQTNKSICLTPDAKMRTRPQLEIYADDVKCSHGATVGQLDENSLFYLKSRGIDSKEAKLMLMFAFANDILQKINVEPLQKRMSALINARLRGQLSDCSHCLLGCHKEKNI
jgi:Fe-S cluster assembly protein SufD